MALFYQLDICEDTRLAVWKIEETEDFFDLGIPLRREITHPHKRLQHLAGRYMLPYLFADFPNHEIELAETRKPFLPNEQYHFSISHGADFAAAIVSRNDRVGIDVELMSSKLHFIKNKFLHNEELQFVHSYEEAEQLKVLAAAWSAKEAMYKWYGLGQIAFSEMLRIKSFELNDEGVIDAMIRKDSTRQHLQVKYKFFNNVVLAWVHQQFA